jgi:2-oxoglutarate dehydrogenase complex, dehydrogenase (E1) component, and related enzymes
VSEKITNLSEYFTENFGANASYVEGLLARYKTDPNTVDESWRTFFGDLLKGEAPADLGGNGQAVTTASASKTNRVYTCKTRAGDARRRYRT